MDCLKNIIGLSSSDCACFQDDRPVDYNTSKTGLNLADDFRLSLTTTGGAADCEQGGVWDILDKARSRGISDFLTHFPLSLVAHRNLQPTQKDFIGEIGSRVFNSFIEPSNPIVGMRIDPHEWKSKQKKFVLNGVSMAFDGVTVPVNIEVFVYSNLDLSTPISSVTVAITNPNTFYSATFAQPVLLDLDPKQNDVKYYIVYSLPAGLNPVNSNIEENGGCGCGRSKINERNFYLEYANYAGIEAVDYASLGNASNKTSTKANGLVLDTLIYCDYLNQLCSLATNILDVNGAVLVNGQAYSLGVVMAKAIGHKAAVYVINKIIDSGGINRYTLMDGERLRGIREYNEKGFSDNMHVFASLLPDYYLDACFMCKKGLSSSIVSIPS